MTHTVSQIDALVSTADDMGTTPLELAIYEIAETHYRENSQIYEGQTKLALRLARHTLPAVLVSRSGSGNTFLTAAIEGKLMRRRGGCDFIHALLDVIEARKETISVSTEFLAAVPRKSPEEDDKGWQEGEDGDEGQEGEDGDEKEGEESE